MSDERFERLADAEHARLVGYVMKISRDLSREDARDIAQVALFEVSRRIAGISEGSEVAYLYKAARGRALRLLDERRRRPEDDLDPKVPFRDQTPQPDEALLQREQQSAITARIHSALAALPEITRLCLLGRMRGLSCETIAGRLQMTSVAVRTRLSRAYGPLREAVGEIPEWFEWPETAEEDGHGDEK